MQEVRNKFNNFKKFILEIDNKNEWIIYFQNITLELFLYTMREKMKEKPDHTIDTIYLDIITTAQLDDEKVGKDRERVKLYINYFLDIINSTK